MNQDKIAMYSRVNDLQFQATHSKNEKIKK